MSETSYHYLLERRKNIIQLKERADELAVNIWINMDMNMLIA